MTPPTDPAAGPGQPLSPAVGWGVLHLFCQAPAQVDATAVAAAVEAARRDGYQVVAAALLGHKADVALMALGPDLWRLRQFQSAVARAGLRAVASYVSLTEVSEYAAGVPDELKQARLFPQLPPEGKPAFCFYPMSKRRTAGHNWYASGFDERRELMMGHGKVGRTFAGRVLQVVTGSTGLDDFEWGVTLFGVHPDDLKDCVYQMRFDEASAHYAEFGPFYTGMVADVGQVLATLPGGRGLVTAALADLEAELERLERVVVAFSGGADSAFLARVAHDTLGADRVLCATAVSPSLAPAEEADCRALAAEWGLRWVGVPTDELDDPRYVANGPDRCARCKTALMASLGPLARAESATVVLGVNLDDLGDHRPGQQAAQRAGAAFPLVAASFTKADVRRWSRTLGLRTWDKPAAACLASRLPYGTPVTIGTLRAVAEAEAALGDLGLVELRVRHHGDVARLEVGPDELDLVLARRHEVVAAVRSAGYAFVALDLEGFRSGSLNRVLGRADPVAPPEPARHAVAGAVAPGRGGPVIQVKVKLTFPESLVRRPVLATLVREFDVEPNIRRADVEEHRGWILCEIDGEPAQVEAALAWLRQEGITVDLQGGDVLEG